MPKPAKAKRAPVERPPKDPPAPIPAPAQRVIDFVLRTRKPQSKPAGE